MKKKVYDTSMSTSIFMKQDIYNDEMNKNTHPTVVRRTVNEEDLKLAKSGLITDIESNESEQDKDALAMALRGSKIYQEAQGMFHPTVIRRTDEDIESVKKLIKYK